MAEKIKELSCADCIYYENWWDEYYNEEEDDYDEYEYAKCKLYERELDPWDFHELHTIAEKCSNTQRRNKRMVKSWDITIDEFIHVLQIMKEESGGNTIIGTATDVTEKLKFFDTKVKGWDGMWKHKKAIQYDTKLVSSEMVMKEEEE